MTKRNPDKPCGFCGEMFHPYRSALRYCSNTCSSRAQYVGMSRPAKCAACGKDFISRFKRKSRTEERRWTQCCGRSCAGKMASTGGSAASRRRQRYGIEPYEYETRLKMQDGGCGFCGRKPHYDLYVDHNHETGQVRGLLCQNCNMAAAFFDANDFERVKAMWNYTRGEWW